VVALKPSWRRPLVLIAALSATLLTARLGFWQLDRAAQKISASTTLAARSTQPRLSSAELGRRDDDLVAQQFRRIELRGRWLARRTVFLDNRARDGVAGFVVVTPLELAAGDAVLVQRGWVARDAGDRERTPQLVSAEGPVSVFGQIVAAPSQLFELGVATSGVIRQNLAPLAYGREIGVNLRPLSVQQLATEAGGDERLIHEWPVAGSDPGRNLGYAFQWFSFSALIAGLYVWFQLIRPQWLARRSRSR
jgi:surfeit locus 1 family protein